MFVCGPEEQRASCRSPLCHPHLGELQAENPQACENLCAEAALLGVGNMLLLAGLSKVQPVLPFPASITGTVPGTSCGDRAGPSPLCLCRQSCPCGQLMARESPGGAKGLHFLLPEGTATLMQPLSSCPCPLLCLFDLTAIREDSCLSHLSCQSALQR